MRARGIFRNTTPELAVWGAALLVTVSIFAAALSGRPASVGGWFGSPWAAAVSAVIAVGAALAAILALRRARGERAVTPIVVQYGPPPGFRPGDVAMLVFECLRPRDATAIVIDLAMRGHLTIDKMAAQAEEWRLRYRPQDHGDLREHEKIVLAGLFDHGQDVALADLAPHFFVAIGMASDSLEEEARARGWFVALPSRVRRRWRTVGAVIAVAGLCLLVPLGTYLGAGLVGLTLVACGLTLVAASPWMPRRTQSGIEALRWAHGFELYMQTAERDRQLFAERDSDRFLDNLPYAVVLGCAERWVARLHALDSPGLAYLSFTEAALRQAAAEEERRAGKGSAA